MVQEEKETEFNNNNFGTQLNSSIGLRKPFIQSDSSPSIILSRTVLFICYDTRLPSLPAL